MFVAHLHTVFVGKPRPVSRSKAQCVQSSDKTGLCLHPSLTSNLLRPPSLLIAGRSCSKCSVYDSKRKSTARWLDKRADLDGSLCFATAIRNSNHCLSLCPNALADFERLSNVDRASGRQAKIPRNLKDNMVAVVQGAKSGQRIAIAVLSTACVRLITWQYNQHPALVTPSHRYLARQE